jgi:FtsP/CotA-like multicopper oxidase with cupredoxin domain
MALILRSSIINLPRATMIIGRDGLAIPAVKNKGIPNSLMASQTRICTFSLLVMLMATGAPGYAQKSPTTVQPKANEVCPAPAEGSAVPEPEDLRSQNGVLQVSLEFRAASTSRGKMRYCYISGNGGVAPNLRLHPGDTLILKLKNEVSPSLPIPDAKMQHAMHSQISVHDPCGRSPMSAFATNLHFHGLAIPPVCHQDEVMKTAIQPSDPVFEYRIQIPANQPSGLYWYHPHIHGFSSMQLSGGASGALIIEGIERTNRELAGLGERVFVVRDQDLLNPDAPPAKTEAFAPKIRLDRDGDVQNTGTGTGKPAKDLSLNYVPVPYPDYPTAVIRMKPEERQLWRVLNASTVTYLNLQLLFDCKAQMLEVVALDGVPVNTKGASASLLAMRNHLGVPPGGRVEFIAKAPPDGVAASLANRTVNTGPGGENDPNRPLATVVTLRDAPEPASVLPGSPEPLSAPALPWLGDVTPTRTRKLFFSEKLEDPNDPNSPTTFYITLDGQTPTPFDPNSDVPSIVVKQGEVEDWIIENRSNELHAFHIHQIHFLMLDWNGIPVNEPFLRDTINVPFYDGKHPDYPSVRLRMDFRDPNIIGTFLYHCHLLDHEDNGMMALIRVEAAGSDLATKRGIITGAKSPSGKPAVGVQHTKRPAAQSPQFQ